MKMILFIDLKFFQHLHVAEVETFSGVVADQITCAAGFALGGTGQIGTSMIVMSAHRRQLSCLPSVLAWYTVH
jgi:hypothetical protein